MNQEYAFILLTGPKHAGKTTAGRAFGQLSSGDFIDLDELIEQRTGKSPRTLYKEGPEYFRLAETEALETLLSMETGQGKAPVIMAAGGGIIDNEAALKKLKTAKVFIVYLEVSAETAWHRIQAAGSLPPFLDTPNPQETHKKLHQRRAEAYKTLAHITIQSEGKTPESLAQDIQRFFKSYSKNS
ncbi:MAG: shikimate kinase [Treponema sp.]|jgi:shikimate kinase|nr:shikimate kinase [Treponema sp.]